MENIKSGATQFDSISREDEEIRVFGKHSGGHRPCSRAPVKLAGPEGGLLGAPRMHWPGKSPILDRRLACLTTH